MSLDHLPQAILVITLQLLIIGTQQDIAIPKAHIDKGLAEIHTLLDILQRQVSIAPGEQHHRIDEQRENEIEQHTANHDHQTLARGLRAELVGLRRLRHLLLIHALVDHAGDLTIATKRQPADTVFRIAILRLKLEQREPGVKEEVELLHSHLKQPGKNKMPELMHQHQ